MQTRYFERTWTAWQRCAFNTEALACCLAAMLALASGAAKSQAYDSSHRNSGYLIGGYEIATENGLTTDALHRIDRDLADDPRNGRLHAQRGFTLIRAGRPGDAAGEFRIVAAMRPDDATPHGLMGWALLLDGHASEAAAEFTRALQTHRLLDTAGVYGLLSLALERKGDNQNALTTLASALKAAGADDAWVMLDVRCDAGGRIGLLKSAQESCDDAIVKRPRNEAAYEGRGLIDLKTGHWQAAIDDYTRALYYKPGNVVALYGRGLARRALKDPGGAADLQAASAHEPDIGAILTRYGVVAPP